jgi:hypothetical protein
MRSENGEVYVLNVQVICNGSYIIIPALSLRASKTTKTLMEATGLGAEIVIRDLEYITSI